MSSTSNLSFSENPVIELKNLYRITNAIYMRNKNQHRRSHWWISFNMFRKQLRHLTSSELDASSPFNTLTADSSAIAAYPSPLLRPVGQRRVAYWITGLIQLWHKAFSQLLTERRFASMGVVLLAVLARTCWLVGATQALTDGGGVELVDKMQTESEALRTDSGVIAAAEGVMGGFEVSGEEVDFGEVVEREQIEKLPDVEESAEANTESPSINVTERKRRRGENDEKTMKKILKLKNDKKKKSSKREIDDI